MVIQKPVEMDLLNVSLLEIEIPSLLDIGKGLLNLYLMVIETTFQMEMKNVIKMDFLMELLNEPMRDFQK